MGFAKICKQGTPISLALLFALAMTVFVYANGVNGINGANTVDDEYENGIVTPQEPIVEEPLWNDDMIADRNPTRRVQHVTLRGVFPDIQPAFGPAYEALNEHISTAASAMIENALRLRARTVTFSYEVHATVDVVSIVMNASIAAVTTRETVKSINFSPRTGELLNLEEAMGFNVAPLAERILTEWMRDNPERYYSALTAPLSSFYLTETRLVFLFDEFQISTVAGSPGRLELTRAHIMALPPIAPAQYKILEDVYNIKMVPVGVIARYMGYNAQSQLYLSPRRVHIWRDDTRAHLMMTLILGENSYDWEGNFQRPLEAAPILYNGRTLIPITFFDQIMPRTTYHVDEYGYIHFLAYRSR